MIRLFSATLLSLLLCASLANAAEKPLIVASDATWPPIEMLDENKNVVGYSIDYLKAVAKEAGLNVEFRNIPALFYVIVPSFFPEDFSCRFPVRCFLIGTARSLRISITFRNRPASPCCPASARRRPRRRDRPSPSRIV